MALWRETTQAIVHAELTIFHGNFSLLRESDFPLPNFDEQCTSLI